MGDRYKTTYITATSVGEIANVASALSASPQELIVVATLGSPRYEILVREDVG